MVKSIYKKLIFPLNLALQAAFSLQYEIVQKQNSRKGPTPTCFTKKKFRLCTQNINRMLQKCINGRVEKITEIRSC